MGSEKATDAEPHPCNQTPGQAHEVEQSSTNQRVGGLTSGLVVYVSKYHTARYCAGTAFAPDEQVIPGMVASAPLREWICEWMNSDLCCKMLWVVANTRKALYKCSLFTNGQTGEPGGERDPNYLTHGSCLGPFFRDILEVVAEDYLVCLILWRDASVVSPASVRGEDLLAVWSWFDRGSTSGQLQKLKKTWEQSKGLAHS